MNYTRSVNGLVILTVLVSCPLWSWALNNGIVDRICIADPSKPPMLRTAPIPVGCELVDCCPGCPGSGAFEWRINMDSRTFGEAELKFEGFSGEELRQLRLDGPVRLDGDRLRLRPGQTRIGGIPYKQGEPVRVGLLRPIAERMKAQPPRAGDGSTDQIRVTQHLGGFIVNDFDWRFYIRPCQRVPKPPLRLEDKLQILGLDLGDEVVAMLDARRKTGCHDGGAGASSEWVFASSGTSSFENLLNPGTCNSELAIFSKKHRAHLERPVTTWTNAPGDVHTVTLQPLMDVEVHIWVSDDATLAKAQTQIDTARALYIENRVGVRFVGRVRKLSDVTSDPNPEAVVNAGVSADGLQCLELGPIQSKPYYTPKTLNIYYVGKPFKGRNCAIKRVPTICTSSATAFPPGDANINFIGSLHSSTTLAHEIGHAYGLRPAICGGHTEPPKFGPDNIMAAGGGDERVSLTLGQVFRMHSHMDAWGGSMLIHNNIPSAPARLCAPNVIGPACPALEVDWP